MILTRVIPKAKLVWSFTYDKSRKKPWIDNEIDYSKNKPHTGEECIIIVLKYSTI
jgi:hypothetical protein